MSLSYERNDKNQNKVATSSSNTDKNIDPDLETLAKLRKHYPSSPMIGYLNVNIIRNKIVQLTGICKTFPTEILYIDETKFDSSFPNAQVHFPDYQFPPFQRDRNSSEEEK